MTAANLFQLELVSALAGRKALILRLGLPMLLGLPFAMVSMPAGAKAGGLTMLVLFITTMGAAVATVRRRNSGQLRQLHLLPGPRWLTWLDLLLAGAMVDVVQLAPVMIVFCLARGGAAAATVAALLAWTLVAAAVFNALGMAIAAAVRGNAEVHLVAALAVGVVAFLAGIFPTPEAVAPLVDAVASVNPAAALASNIRAVANPRDDGTAAGGIVGVSAAGIFMLVAIVRALDLLPRRRRMWHNTACARTPEPSESSP